MKISIDLFKRITIEIPEVVFEVFSRVDSKVLEANEELVTRFVENEELASSWILSVVSPYKNSADYALATISNGSMSLSIGVFIRNKPSKQVLIAPSISKLYRVIYVEDSGNSSSPSRETAISSSSLSNAHIYTPPEEYYVFESMFIPKVDRGILIFEHDYGNTLIDIKEFMEFRASSTEVRQSKTSKSSSRSSKGSRSKKGKRSKRRKVASSK